MQWLIFAAISIVSIAFGNIFQKMAMKAKESDPVSSSIIFQMLLAVFTGIFAFIRGFELPPSALLFPYIFFSTICYAFGTLLFFKAIKIIEASEMTILSGFGAVVTIISAYLFINERLTPHQLAGVFLVLVSVVVVEYKRKSYKFNRGFFYSLLGTSLFGVAVTNDTFILKTYDAVSYTPLVSFLPGVVLCSLFPRKAINLYFSLRKRINKNLILYSFLYSIQAVTYYLALGSGALASQMNAIFKTEVILTVALASVYLKEKQNFLKKVLAAALTTMGVILIAR